MRRSEGLVEGFRTAAAGFACDRGGNFAVLFGVVATTLAVSVGLAVDTVQLVNARSALAAAVDAAVTSTARDLTTGAIKPADAEARVQNFITANSPGGILSYDGIVLDRLTVDHTAKTIEVAAHVDVPLFFPVFADKVKRVSNVGAALYSDRHIEVAMMLDLTGSMQKSGKTDKIGDLRDAATNAVNTMLANQDPKNPRVRVALVPYASGVNVGALAAGTYAETGSSPDLPPLAGSPLLVAKTGLTTLPAYGDYVAAVAEAYPNADNCATERKDRDGKPDFSADGPDTVRADASGKQYYALVNRDDRLSGSGMNKCPDARVIPLTGDSAALLSSIGDFKANGYTAGAIAVQWTYYMLSPKWRAAIQSAGLGSGPADADPKKIAKVAILMTDGQFNTAYAGASGSNPNGQGALSRSSAESLCSNMKADGIQVFTIGFDLNNKSMNATERTQAKSVLQNCASPDMAGVTHYFEASTGADLDKAFQEIIRNTERVALTM